VKDIKGEPGVSSMAAIPTAAQERMQTASELMEKAALQQANINMASAMPGLGMTRESTALRILEPSSQSSKPPLGIGADGKVNDPIMYLGNFLTDDNVDSSSQQSPSKLAPLPTLLTSAFVPPETSGKGISSAERIAGFPSTPTSTPTPTTATEEDDLSDWVIGFEDSDLVSPTKTEFDEPTEATNEPTESIESTWVWDEGWSTKASAPSSTDQNDASTEMLDGAGMFGWLEVDLFGCFNGRGVPV
jgi:hypothetical protein